MPMYVMCRALVAVSHAKYVEWDLLESCYNSSLILHVCNIYLFQFFFISFVGIFNNVHHDRLSEKSVQQPLAEYTTHRICDITFTEI